jgi:SWIM zinc finger
MAVVEQTYAYLAPSTVAVDSDGTEVTLSTSGGGSPHPYFFTGFLGEPRQTAQALLVVAEVARTRYYIPPGSASRLAAADPVVTSNVDRLRFESFSGCAGVYARLDLEPELLGGEAAAWGTTNVDFNLPMRAALARVHDADAMLMHVGHDEVRVTTLAGSEVERKVPLPERWVKGFAEVQVSASRMLLRHELGRVEARRFLQSLPRTRSRGVAWATPAGGTLRLTTQPDDGAVCIAGPERLRLLEKLLPFARSLRVYGPLPTSPRVAEPSAWELVLNGGRVVFVISPELFRGFSGEGGVLSALAAADDAAVEAVAELLHGEPAIDSAAVAETSRFDRTTVETALGALGAAGRVGYDLSAGSFFHRELPYDRAILDSMHPRLLGARELVDAGAVRVEGAAATVTSGDVEYVVRFDDDAARCTCAWFARHRGERGPCKHVLAAEQVRRSARVT